MDEYLHKIPAPWWTKNLKKHDFVLGASYSTMEEVVRTQYKGWGVAYLIIEERVATLKMCQQICKDKKLTPFQTAEMLATLMFEAGFNNTLTNKNKNAKGVVTSTDWGLCQINDYWHIGKNKSFPSVEYVLANPDKVVMWMADMWKAGKGKLWVAYSGGYYKKYFIEPSETPPEIPPIILPPKPPDLEEKRKAAEALKEEIIKENTPTIEVKTGILWVLITICLNFLKKVVRCK